MLIQYDDTTGETPEYKAFVDKFKPKKTTDDCCTPENVYAAVRDFASKEYGLAGRRIIRPFWPGGDYENYDYPEGCVVVDNPPFSCLSEICRYYDERGIDYFLFAPNLTLFSTNAGRSNYVIAGVSITYDNGARVNTGFVTNMGNYKIQLRPDLHDAIKAADDENTKPAADQAKYEYPRNLVTAARLKTIARYEQLKITPESCIFTRTLDAQRKRGKGIYGAGFLLRPAAAAEKAAAEKAAAEKAAAEKAAAVIWQLSDRERAMLEEGTQ